MALAATGVSVCGIIGPARASAARQRSSGDTMIQLQTSLGAITMAVLVKQAPKVTNWFLELVDSGLYDGTKFFRAGHLAGQPDRPRFLEGGPLSPFLLGEREAKIATVAETGLPLLKDWETTAQSRLKLVRGAVSLARDITGDGSVAPDLVFSLEPIPEMDAGGGFSPGNTGFPVIGRVISGMEIIDAIASQPRAGATYVPFLAGQILSEPVVIDRIVRLATQEFQS